MTPELQIVKKQGGVTPSGTKDEIILKTEAAVFTPVTVEDADDIAALNAVLARAEANPTDFPIRIIVTMADAPTAFYVTNVSSEEGVGFISACGVTFGQGELGEIAVATALIISNEEDNTWVITEVESVEQ